MSSSRKRIGKLGHLVLSSAAFALAGPAVSGAQVAQKTELAATAQLARHFQHEDALYGKLSSVETGAATAAIALHFNHEDALYAARQSFGQGRTPTQAIALHFRHEDAIYAAKGSGSGARTPVQAIALHFDHEDRAYGVHPRVASSLSPVQMLARHYRHEDALYGAQRSAAAVPVSASTSNGFDWNDALVGAGGAVGLMLLSASAAVAVQRSRRRLARS